MACLWPALCDESVSECPPEGVGGSDFFTVELWTGRALIRYHVLLFVIELATRELQIVGLVPEPNEAWIMQVARNLIDPWEVSCVPAVCSFTIGQRCSVSNSVKCYGVGEWRRSGYQPVRRI